MNTLILLVFAVMIAVEQATPISINNTTPTVSVQKTISVLKVEARNGVNSVYQDILTLESNNVRHSYTYYEVQIFLCAISVNS